MFRKREAAYRELQQRNDRQINLSRMAGSMDMEKAIMVSCPAELSRSNCLHCSVARGRLYSDRNFT